MKKRLNILLWSAVSLPVVMAGCTGHETGGSIAAGQVKIGIIAEETDPLSRTVIEGDRIDGFGIAWTQADKLGVFTHAEGVDGQYLTFNSEFGVDGEIVDGRAAFSGNISCHPTEEMTYSLYAYYPHTPHGSIADASHRAVAGEIPALQQMTADGSFDPSADYMAAVSGREITISGGSAESGPVTGFLFRRLVTFMNVSVKDIIADELDPSIDLSPENAVESVSMKLTKQGAEAVLTGNFTLDLTDGAMDFSSNVSPEPDRVEVVCPQGTTLGSLEAWLVTAPFGMSPGDELLVTISTDEWEISKTIASASREFIAGGIKTLNMIIDSGCNFRRKAVAGPDRFVITPYQLKDSFAESDGEHTALSDNGLEVTYFTNRVMGNMRPEIPQLQWWQEIGYIYNITDMGRISSIVVNDRFSITGLTLLEGPSMEPSSGTKVPYTVEGNNYVFHFSGDNGYFYFHNANSPSVNRLDYIEVNYVK